MLTVSSIDEAYKCYKQMNRLRPDLNIGCIFSTDPNGEGTGEDQKTSQDRLKEIIDDYNKKYEASYGLNNYYSYQKNLADKIKNGVIDLIIVVNVFTTGFDAPRLNTLYVARELKMHNLIQAFARVCRTLNNKAIGNIRCLLRTQEKHVKEAFGYYAKGVEIDKSIPVISKDYKVVVNHLNDILNVIKEVAPTPDDARNLSLEKDVIKFMTNIRNFAYDVDNFFLPFDEKK
jgi:type I restriction enzyme R subunit